MPRNIETMHPIPNNIQKSFDNIINEYHIPGAILAIDSPTKGTYILKHGFSNIDTKTPVDIDTLWPIRSITKSFTVSLILQLVDEGRISLDDTISKYISNIPNGNNVNLRQLANMSAGIPDYVSNTFVEEFNKNPNKLFTLNELNNYIGGQTLLSQPGEKYIYNNANINLLGRVVEQVMGQPFAAVLESKLLIPLGLHNTHYITDVKKTNGKLATGYQFIDGKWVIQPNNLSIYGPSGGMVSTLSDQLKWAYALGQGIFLTPQTNATKFDAHQFEKGPEYNKYGLGIGELDGWWGHTGNGNGINALTMHNLQTKESIVIFMNISGKNIHPPTKLFHMIVKNLSEK